LIAAGIAVVIVIAGLIVVAGSVKARVEQKIKSDYGDELQISQLHVSLFPTVTASGENVAYRPGGRTDIAPLITIRKFTAETNWFVALGEHVRKVTLDGLVITIPPPADREKGSKPESGKARGLVIDQVVADGTVLKILPKKEGKEPLVFDLYKLTVQRAGEDRTMRFETIMKNAKPPGEIHSSGKFGPWDEEPALTPVSGSYTFDHADLSVFKGIAGMLSSRGNYQGQLDRIEASGETDTPDFRLRISRQPVHLTTQFHAIVDGTDGNTYLQPVNGHFGNSSVVATGQIAGERGTGKTVTLDAVVDNGRMEDMLRLAVPGTPAINGAISFHSKIVVPPGDVDVVDKLQLNGAFTVDQAHFSKLKVQEKVDELSHRGSGDPKQSNDDTVASGFRGGFKLNRGVMTLDNVAFQVPGVTVALDGTYGLDDRTMDLHGTASLQAKLSETTTGVKSFFLKALNPFFEKKNAGAVIPIHIGGTADHPTFGLGKGHDKTPTGGD
jgi:AsmA-like C-terminal region